MGKKISELNKLSSINGAELIPVVSNGSNYTITVNDIKEGLATSEEISNMATQSWVESKNYLVASNIENKADKATSISGYGITDAKIEDGTITLGNQSIKPLTEHQPLTEYAKTEEVDNKLANKADKTELEGLATETFVTSKGYLTEVPSEYAKTADIESKIANVKSEIIGGAGQDYDTLKEIETWVTKHQDLYTGLVTTVGQKAASSDLTSHIENTTVHVTSDEKTTWSGKQDAISDLETIRSNASTAKGWGDHASAGYLTKTEASSTYQTILPTGVNTATSVANVPITKTVCRVNTTSGGSFSLSGTLAAGQEVHVIINNTGSSKITISIPTTFKASVDSLEIESGKFGEINVISDGTNRYLRAV